MSYCSPEISQVENLTNDYNKLLKHIEKLKKILLIENNENIKREIELLNHQKKIIEFYLLPEKPDYEIIMRKTLHIALENIFLYFVIKSKKINKLIKKLQENNIIIPKASFKTIATLFDDKEQKILEECIKYEKYLHLWENNKYDIIEDYHWMFDDQKTFEKNIEKNSCYIKFEDICEELNIGSLKIKKCFKKLQNMKTEEIIEKYEQFMSKNKYQNAFNKKYIKERGKNEYKL